MIREGMVSPMLFQPQPLAAANQIGTESEQLIDPRAFTAGTVIGVVLNAKSNPSLRNAVHDRELPRGSLCDPQVL